MTGVGDRAAAAVPEAAPAAPDLSGWEDPPRVRRADDAPVLTVDGFDGPLDWLLELARDRKINLARLPIGGLITQFAAALTAALAGRDTGQLDRWAGWTVMAATLTELWSRLVLPADPAAAHAAETEAEALRRRLLARARMRQAADWLERRSQLGRDVFPRGAPESPASGRGSDITDLLRACLVALAVPAGQAAAYRPRPPPLWRVSDALPYLRRQLAALPAATPLAALLPPIDGGAPGHGDPARALRCRAAVASTLVAGLELARDGVLVLDQDAAWADIRVSRSADDASHRTAPANAASSA